MVERLPKVNLNTAIDRFAETRMQFNDAAKGIFRTIPAPKFIAGRPEKD